MVRLRTVILSVAAAGAGYAVVRHLRPSSGIEVPGGVLIGDTGVYDTATRLVLGPYYRGVADDVTNAIGDGGHVLEIGCGPGHLAIELANRGLDVTGLDLDAEMIDRARANSRRRVDGHRSIPSFEVGDAALLPYADATFDLVTSTFSLHHWSDPQGASAEIARVLKPNGRALIWDLGSGARFLHGHLPDPALHFHDSPLRLVTATPWEWPFIFTPTVRIELIQA